MSIAIRSLPIVGLDYTNRGPGLGVGLKKLESALHPDGGREGYLVVNVTVRGATVPTVFARTDLYIHGFQCAASWFRFDDAKWPFAEGATKLGYEGRYQSLGGLSGRITLGGIDGIARLANLGERPQWKEPLRTLLIVVSECARLIPVHMEVLGLLNGILPAVQLAPLSRYIQNWAKASDGTDMSQQVGPNQWTGFRDPTIIRR